MASKKPVKKPAAKKATPAKANAKQVKKAAPVKKSVNSGAKNAKANQNLPPKKR